MKTPVILCIDDEAMLLEALKCQLKDHFAGKYQIETVESAEEALEVIEELQEDEIELPVVICDQIMPGMKGDELLIKIHSMLPATLKILLTGQADVEAIGNAVNKANLYHYIAKPWEPTNFNLTIKGAIEHYFQEQKLAQFYADLEKKVAERTKKLHQKNEFLSMAVHDLKNPITAIQGFSEILQFDCQEVDNEEMVEIAGKIFASSQQMFELVKNILEVNAIELGKLELSFSKQNISPIAQGLFKHYVNIAQAKNIKLQLNDFDEKCYVKMDTNSIHRIFDNLISNAIKYSPPNKKILMSIYNKNNKIYFKVQDEGPGLSDEDQQKLFGQFTRLTPQPTGGEHSTGLGLFIVQKLVTTMQGKVWCKSMLGHGATFIVEFPSID
ncbi:hybrid sensor histidine kinase/response regulator [Candidatus Halobeggiatoa sp. HSG11]|nr:hybrid sensor histidine kinase/response regulator [Candidatus Halobeggiatoa sp. HSG11]